eukprot:CAMPEP_0205904698 /NCGR_PEP_ID=MMETSP1325-20131115/889_1 /ASSEMBLY_ACC=CAM_ASM_000708 /TAXON_ID=236786 /ORGANISM="Florenciella sp., Strain RCC1007" /LENGTH=253 /DNA_ID=CAMNT_0053270513 /DNA_START=30 /DNA_END=791 /DNA_ORIENTATION=-
MAMVVAAGSVMQLAANSPMEAVAMQTLAMIFELFEYRTYLQGKTHVDKWMDRAKYASNLVLRRVRGNSAVAPASTAVQSEEAAQTAATASASVGARRDAVKLLTSLVVAMGIMEGAASAMTLGLFLMVPIQPSEVGEEPESTNRLLLLWFITFVFEVMVSEGSLAYLSQKWSRMFGESHFGDVVEVMKSETFSKKNQLVIGIVTICMVTYMHKVMIEALCPTPWNDTGKGLMSFSACCSEDGTPCDQYIDKDW